MTNELISQLVSNLGVTEKQATGGAGALFKLAQNALGNDFTQVSDAIPGVTDMISKAPESDGIDFGNVASMALSAFGAGDSTAGKLGAMTSAIGLFKELDLDSEMVAKFLPLVLDFAKSKGGEAVFDLLTKSFK